MEVGRARGIPGVCVHVFFNLHAIVLYYLLCHCRLVHIMLSHVGDTAGT